MKHGYYAGPTSSSLFRQAGDKHERINERQAQAKEIKTRSRGRRAKKL